ncbi:Serine proteases trypsin domain [Trinorchestia longiramus]|nr:Serine proteases trypsin domain [Trinorchestia longiramus]
MRPSKRSKSFVNNRTLSGSVRRHSGNSSGLKPDLSDQLSATVAPVFFCCSSREILSQNNELPWWVLLTTEANDVIIDSATGEENANLNLEEICCECVPLYQCDENNRIITDGGSILAPRIGANRVFNVESCPDVEQLCCKPRSAPQNCNITSSISPEPRPDETDATCECLHWEFCLSEFRVSDGSEPSTFIEGNPLEAHAKCQHSLEVCCALETEDPVPPVPSPSSSLPGSECICVNPWLCDADNNIITNGADIMNLRRGAEPPPCMAPKLCCRVPEETDRVPATTTARPNRPRDETAPRPEVIADQRCQGIRSPQGISVRIAGFQEGESQFGEFPWVGMVLRTYYVAQTPMNAFIGGAILVHPRVVLTAAHKVAKEPVANLTVRVGEWDIETDFEPGSFQARSVERVILHPEFNPRNLQHDVALVVLSEPVELQSHIRSICLAESLEDVDSSACVINGWGKDSFDNGNYQTVMKSVTLPLVEHNQCQSMMRQTRLGVWFELHSSFVCAGGELGKDACSSDGGGPLACPRRGSTTGEYLLVGITAWGIGCGEDGVPGVYASTVADRSWITSQLESVVPGIVHTAVRRDVAANPSVVTYSSTGHVIADKLVSENGVEPSTSDSPYGFRSPFEGHGSRRPHWQNQILSEYLESKMPQRHNNEAFTPEHIGTQQNYFPPNHGESRLPHYQNHSKPRELESWMSEREHSSWSLSASNGVPPHQNNELSLLQGVRLDEHGKVSSNMGESQNGNVATQEETSNPFSRWEARRERLQREREERRRKREEKIRLRSERERRRRERRRKHQNPFHLGINLISRMLNKN